MLLLFIAFTLLASAITSNKVILYALSPEYLVGIRMTIAALLLAGYVVIKKKHRFNWEIVKKYIFVLAGIALFTTFFPSNLKAYALAHMPSSKMAFFGTLDPFIAAFYSWVLFKERLTKLKWLGLALGICGMLVLIFTSSPLDEQLRAFAVVSYPELAALAAFFISRFGWIIVQHYLKRGLFDPVQINVITMMIGGLISLIVAFLRERTVIKSLAQISLPVLQLPPLEWLTSEHQLWFFLGYTIVIGNIFGYTTYAYALKRYSATFIALAGFVIPLLVHLFGWLLLNEQLSLSFFIACLITFTGVAVFYLDERRAVS